MTGFALKLTALIAMTIDHIGVFLVSSPEWQLLCRAIGRVAMPLFCFFIAQGYRYTSNRTHYFFRLFGFAMLLECCLYIYYLLSGNNYLFSINIFLTLSVGLGCLILFNSKDLRLISVGLILSIAVAFTDLDYGLYGILLILLFGMSTSFKAYALGFFAINLLFIHIIPVLVPEMANFDSLQWFSMLSLLGILLYNNLPGKQSKALFYLYYPLHIALLAVIRDILY